MKPLVLLVADDEALAARWTAWLAADARCRRWTGDSTGDADVVLCAAAAVDRLPFLPSGRTAAGLVVIGGPPRASAAEDAWLPADVEPRELVQTMRLVAQLAALRRQQRAAENRQRALADLAAADPLTGLANRRTWDERLARRWQAAAVADRPLCLAVFDVDHFKPINDEFGHAVGDDVLRRVGLALQAAIRAEDLVARLGGDEFGLLLDGVPPAEAARAVERVRAAIGARLDGGGGGRTTVSAGYAVATPQQLACEGEAKELAGPAELQAAADAALRAAKSAGRDRTCAAS